MIQQFKSIQDIEIFFNQISFKKRDFPALSMIYKALELLNNPERSLKYIHVAGTNGKGSTCTYIAEIMSNHSLRVGLFISPHIHAINERISINNRLISNEDFIGIFNKLYNKLANNCSLIQFEWLTLIAFEYFSQQKVDIVVLETGIGGLFDSTNVIDEKEAVVVTNIDYDHVEMLGPTLIDIAKQKIGIVTENTKGLFVGAIHQQNILPIFKQVSGEKNVPMFQYGIDFNVKDFIKLSPDFAKYQFENIPLAIATAKFVLNNTFDTPLDLKLVEKIINNRILPLRFEKIIYLGKNLILDGAHNIAGINYLLDSLKGSVQQQKLEFLFCAMADKNYFEMIELLENFGGAVNIFDYRQIYERALDIETISNQPVIKTANEFNNFVAKSKSDTIIVVGSIYFVSYIREIVINGGQF